MTDDVKCIHGKKIEDCTKCDEATVDALRDLIDKDEEDKNGS